MSILALQATLQQSQSSPIGSWVIAMLAYRHVCFSASRRSSVVHQFRTGVLPVVFLLARRKTMYDHDIGGASGNVLEPIV